MIKAPYSQDAYINMTIDIRYGDITKIDPYNNRKFEILRFITKPYIDKTRKISSQLFVKMSSII